MKLSANTKISIAVACTLLLTMSGVVAVVIHYVQQKGDALQAQVSFIADQHVRDQSYKALVATVNDSKAQRSELLSRVLTEDKTISFLTNIENDAAQHGVKLVTNSLQPHKEKGMFNTLDISFGLSGTQAAVEHMIKMFETLPYYGHISQVEFTEGGAHAKASSTAKLILTVSLLKK